MTKARIPIVPRYERLDIARRVSRAIATRVPVGEKRTLSIDEVADRLELDVASLRKRLGALTPRGDPRPRTPFTVEECGKLATLYGAPPYWPFAEWPEG